MNKQPTTQNRDALAIGAVLLLPVSLLFAGALALEIAGRAAPAGPAPAAYAAAARAAAAPAAALPRPAGRAPAGSGGHVPGYTRKGNQA